MPEPIASTAPAPATQSSQSDSSGFGALDTRATTLPAREPSEPVNEPKDEGSTFDGLDEVFNDKPKAEAEPAKKEEPAKPAVAPQKPVIEAPRVLRERLESANRELNTSKSELTALKAKITDYEKRNIDTTALNAKLEAREKEFNEIKAERDAANYQKSDDFKAKFEKPFQSAVAYAKEVVEAMTVTQTNPETGEVTAHKPSWNDFADLYRMFTVNPAKAEIEGRKIFGDNYMIAMRHMDKLRELDRSKADAVTEYQATATQRENERIVQQTQQKERFNQAWELTNKDIIDKNPDIFGEHKDDPGRNAIFKESLSLVDQAFTGRDKLTFQQQVEMDAHIRLRAAAYPCILRENAQMKAELDSIKEKQQKKDASKPGETRHSTSGEQPKGEIDLMEDLRQSVTNEPG